MAPGFGETIFTAIHGTPMTVVLPRRLTMSSPTRGSRPFNSAGCTAAWSSILGMAVVATIAIKLKKNLPRTPTSPRYNIRKLQDPAFQQGFAVEVSNRFSALSEDEIGNWSILKTELNSVATKTIGLHKPPKKECCPHEPWKLSK